MKRLLFSILLIPFAAYAATVDESTAMLVARNFWAQEYNEKVTFRDHSHLLNLHDIYLFEESGGRGYIVIAGDDRALPVLGYSRSPFPTDNICPSLVSWLHSYEDQIAYARENDIEADEYVRAEWEALLSGSPLPESKAGITVNQILTSTWNQPAPYNLYCPGTGNNKAPTGCVATAIAQVMRYWKYPEHGTGYNEYNYAVFTDTNFNWQYGTLYADFENAHYEWDLMPDNVTNQTDSASIKAVALINYHCGIALNMLYAPNGSMAFVTVEDNILFDTNYYPVRIAAENVIPHFFAYSPELDGRLSKEFDLGIDWINLLCGDLSKGLPIVFAGAAAEGPSAGHCFILDGCNVRQFFHCNFGWGGLYDGNFRVDALTPHGSNFNMRQQALIGMRPPDVYTVKVTCEGEATGATGVYQAGEPMCGKFAHIKSGSTDNHLTAVADSGYVISAIVSGTDTLFKDSAIVDGTNLIFQPNGGFDTIIIDYTSLQADTTLTVVFDAKPEPDPQEPLSIAQTVESRNSLKAYSTGGRIVVVGTTLNKGTIVDMLGRKVGGFDAHGRESIAIDVPCNGLYIVHCNGQACKVIVTGK